jgi:hypothetical protein
MTTRSLCGAGAAGPRFFKAIEPEHPYFGTFRAESTSGRSYSVEIRSLNGFANSCDCIDYRVNGLGTCKHIEGTLAAMARGRAKSFRAAKTAGSPRVEIFLDRHNNSAPGIMWPAEQPDRDYKAARDWLRPYLAAGGTLVPNSERIEALLTGWDQAPPAVRAIVRVSRHFTPWFDRLRRERQRVEARAVFEADVRRGARPSTSLSIRCCPTNVQAFCILPLANARRSRTRWVSGKPSKALRRASCWPGLEATSVCSWSAPRR